MRVTVSHTGPVVASFTAVLENRELKQLCACDDSIYDIQPYSMINSVWPKVSTQHGSSVENLKLKSTTKVTLLYIRTKESYFDKVSTLYIVALY